MTEESILQKIRGGLIVSCQALENEPLYGADIMARMAIAAESGGAVGIRANGANDIRQIKSVTTLPVIGILKRKCHGSDVYITPTLEDVEEVLRAGADIVAVDATQRPRPGGQLGSEFVALVKQRFPEVVVVADVSTYHEGVLAAQAGADVVASTLSGYTEYTFPLQEPDFPLIGALSESLSIPVVAEGRIRTPRQAAQCLRLGAWAVVVGSAITRPQEITQSFVESLHRCLQEQTAEGEQRV
ncbi:N-acetylmannosamine-6-phosphate 2-epimerase [Alicyclobacillus shizuokensis]|uniref:N-acetylmannosamine-6-phosphate 2-epimerase n=1 Tax=Alicyclobacillus shizuokensis TaxID=392014 RepID=UPI00082C4898|nr:N-acetylmannosamine-6-phosphate 2-epimerase [Alicyclobacillus shizuokensis]MCL6625111.1 N-acetylmannosamine-6-phosphate 2-epimerase [Alicyclobacillus shizuokensis]